MSAFRLVFASVPPFSAATPESLFARERRLETEAGEFFAALPAFFGWEGLAAEKWEQEKQRWENH